MTFGLKCFRPLWSTADRSLAARARDVHRVLASISAQGFDGIEASLNELDQLKNAREPVGKHALQVVVNVYSGWNEYENTRLYEQFDSVSRHLARYQKQLETAVARYRDQQNNITWINAHAGSDHWDKKDQLEFLAHALEIERRLGVENLSYVTHRGRIFHSPWNTIAMLDAFPSLKLTLDFADWCAVTARLLDSEFDDVWLQRVLPHVYHVKGQLFPKQAADGSLPSLHEMQRWKRLREDIWDCQLARFEHAKRVQDVDTLASRSYTTLTLELDAPSQASALWGQDEKDVDELYAQQLEHQRHRFDEFLQTQQIAAMPPDGFDPTATRAYHK